jgi:hypothetical protein
MESRTAIYIKAVAPDAPKSQAHIRSYGEINAASVASVSVHSVSGMVSLYWFIAACVSPLFLFGNSCHCSHPLTCSFAGRRNIPADVSTCAHSLEVKWPLFPVLIRVRRIMGHVRVRYSGFSD